MIPLVSLPTSPTPGHWQEVQPKPTSQQEGVLLPYAKYSFTPRETKFGTFSELVLPK